ncbi:Uu.00g077910.m01.CDS01 [Anthostomella pinea]|uniref:Uu.00g077910.m01.CDS01 n=1 Tax=Anthostomella pinea TaxID=933095 RepID=A0AAI8VKH5_9PEZI|nr:Uu.00g077910.m01.CDS01 [Anthostomella pinea]
MTSNSMLQFGVEIELLIGSRSKNHKSWKSLASELSVRLADAGISNHLNEGNIKSVENYHEWSITHEVTVPMQAGKNLWGLELVSPVFTPEHAWTTDLSTIFKVLKAGFTISPSSNCSTHVHVSTSPPMHAVDLAAIAKSILYFEPAIDTLLPSSRASSYWCQSNHANPALKSLSTAQCFEYIEYCPDVSSIVRTMCLFSAKSAYGRANGYTEDFVHGVYKWDFSGLEVGGIGTLEFRQAPGSRSAEDVATWVELAVCFVAGAMEPSVVLDPQGQVTMDELWWLLSVGVQVTGISELRGVEKLYAQAGKKTRASR